MKYSIVVAYRDRAHARVRRFLDSLKTQTLTDFELIFINYGSSPEYTEAIEMLTNEYSFCKYFYSWTSGMYWNRSHALNTGIRRATGEYIICTDIDMIFSSKVLENASKYTSQNTVLYQQVYLLPKSLQAYDSLIMLPTEFPTSGDRGKGGFHVAPRALHERILGFDEFFKIWGMEDNDWANRAKDAGASFKWLQLDKAPIYHQWHKLTAIHAGAFSDWWWNELSLHYQLNKSLTRIHQTDWGALVTPDLRPILTLETSNTIQVEKRILSFKRHYLFEDVYDWIITHSDSVVSLKCHREQIKERMSIPEKMIGMKHILQGKTNKLLPDRSAEESLDFVLLTLITKTNLVRDYEILKKAATVEVRILTQV